MEISQELRSLVHQSVALLGNVIQRELGSKSFQRIENLRVQMTALRDVSASEGWPSLQKSFKQLQNLNSQEQHEIAHSFTLMLELMNACENAYRSYRLQKRKVHKPLQGEVPHAIIYVLTAHPTEARSPQNIAVFHEIQRLMIEILNRHSNETELLLTESESSSLFHFLEIAWRTSVVRNRSPKVKDEAEHIYSLLFREDVFPTLIEKKESHVPFYVRSWVGGDKDGHPGVDEKVLLESLTLSRREILKVIRQNISLIRETLKNFSSDSIQQKVAQLENTLIKLKTLGVSDAKSVSKFRQVLSELKNDYVKLIGAPHPNLQSLLQIAHTFPGLVVPLELREASNVLMSDFQKRRTLAIHRMLSTVEKVSRGGDPRWYARGFIISMAESLEHIQRAAQFQKDIFGAIPIPVIPLFEEASSLAEADQIISQMTEDPTLRKACVKNWNGFLEMMVGYSDSAKEAGVLASRLAISEALPKLEAVCQKAKLTPIFFHGSGGSIDRGGGSIENQTAWWPKSALRYYKVTVQGEMVDRSLATKEIAGRKLETVIESAASILNAPFDQTTNATLREFAHQVSEKYRAQTTDPEFLKMVQAATPYSYLNVLKIGSRPSKRTAELTVKGLRAIPWVLCWTQTRVLFPTWWGVGSTWTALNKKQQSELKKAFLQEPVFNSYIKALGFTLAKIELVVWRMYLEQSHLPKDVIQKFFKEFETELNLTIQCYQDICEEKNFTWFRPWLGESIVLRSSMIHPLNILQIIAKEKKDRSLLRLTVTGISSGMLTTG